MECRFAGSPSFIGGQRVGFKRNSIPDKLQAAGLFVLYAVFLVLSSVFVIAFMAVRALVRPRVLSDESDVRPRTALFGLLDILSLLVTYLLADLFRVLVIENKPWPEELEGYGSTLTEHGIMLAFILPAWIAILAWLGWYRPRRRSPRWRAVNTAAASVLLGLSMGAFAMIAARTVYPRWQIALVVLLLPFVTGIVRSVADPLFRRKLPETAAARGLDPAY
jgi:hypothetical protein